jgi:exodeoxyribonuclease VII large subunit
MNQPKFFNLSAITKRISEVLQPAIGKSFWLKAEISSGRERGGSFYCDLVETDASGKIVAKMSCTIWSRDLRAIKERFKSAGIPLVLDNGTTVGFQCSIQYNPQYGLSLKVTDADPAFSLGELELKKRGILERLQKEGLFEINKLLPVPMLPMKIGLITSHDSAAYNDFLKTLTSTKIGFKVYVADASMQGNQTESTVINALNTLMKLDLELVVIIRGGGSKTDLYSLDNEVIARMIASYPLPVWTGIGHEIDKSVLDYVANKGFKTPTAVAEEIVARFNEMKSHLQEAENRFRSTWSYRLQMGQRHLSDVKIGIQRNTRKLLDVCMSELRNNAHRLSGSVHDRLSREKNKLQVSQSSLQTFPITCIHRNGDRLDERAKRFRTVSFRNIEDQKRTRQNIKERFQPTRFLNRIINERQNTSYLGVQLKRQFIAQFNSRSKDICRLRSAFNITKILNRIQNEWDRINAFQSVLTASDPKTSLKRGFSLVYNDKGDVIRSIKSISRNDDITTEVHDGKIISTVQQTEEKQIWQMRN